MGEKRVSKIQGVCVYLMDQNKNIRGPQKKEQKRCVLTVNKKAKNNGYKMEVCCMQNDLYCTQFRWWCMNAHVYCGHGIFELARILMALGCSTPQNKWEDYEGTTCDNLGD